MNIVNEKLMEMPLMEQDPQKVAQDLVKEAIYKKITDNITVILATLNRGIDSTITSP